MKYEMIILWSWSLQNYFMWMSVSPSSCSCSLSLMPVRWSALPLLWLHSDTRRSIWGTTPWRNPTRTDPTITTTTTAAITAETKTETEIKTETKRRDRGLWIHLQVVSLPARQVSEHLYRPCKNHTLVLKHHIKTFCIVPQRKYEWTDSDF